MLTKSPPIRRGSHWHPTWVPLVVSAIVFVMGVSMAADVRAESGRLSDAELERLASLPEDQIDTGQVALILATEPFPGLDVPSYSAQLDRMAMEIRQLTKGSTDPDYRIRAMNTYLYKRQGFHYDHDDPYAQQLTNRYLNGILTTNTGSCTTMPLLYLALAQRLGYPIYPVAAPQHLFCRYVHGDGTHDNIEATSGGGLSSDDEYIRDLEIPAQGIKSGAYMKTMTRRQLVGDLIAENGTYWARQQDLPRTIRYWLITVRFNPEAAEVWQLLGHGYRKLAGQYERLQAGGFQNPTLAFTNQLYRGYTQEYRQEADQALQQARALGVAPPLQANYWLRQQELAQAHRTQTIAPNGGNR